VVLKMGYMKNIDLELFEENVSWEEIPSVLVDYKDYLKTLDDIRKEEQKEFITDIKLNSFME